MGGKHHGKEVLARNVPGLNRRQRFGGVRHRAGRHDSRDDRSGSALAGSGRRHRQSQRRGFSAAEAARRRGRRCAEHEDGGVNRLRRSLASPDAMFSEPAARASGRLLNGHNDSAGGPAPASAVRVGWVRTVGVGQSMNNDRGAVCIEDTQIPW